MDSHKRTERDVEKLWILKVYLQVKKKTSMFVDVTITRPKKENEINKFITFI